MHGTLVAACTLAILFPSTRVLLAAEITQEPIVEIETISLEELGEAVSVLTLQRPLILLAESEKGLKVLIADNKASGFPVPQELFQQNVNGCDINKPRACCPDLSGYAFVPTVRGFLRTQQPCSTSREPSINSSVNFSGKLKGVLRSEGVDEPFVGLSRQPPIPVNVRWRDAGPGIDRRCFSDVNGPCWVHPQSVPVEACKERPRKYFDRYWEKTCEDPNEPWEKSGFCDCDDEP